MLISEEKRRLGLIMEAVRSDTEKDVKYAGAYKLEMVAWLAWKLGEAELELKFVYDELNTLEIK
jgi:hypothetical protein